MFKMLSRLTLSSTLLLALGLGSMAQVVHPNRTTMPEAITHQVTLEAIDNSRLFWNKQVAFCDDSAVLNRVRSRFSYQVHHVPQLPDVAIVGFRKIHEHRLVPGTDYSNPARRYCGATADFSDGHSRSIYYLIVDEGGFTSVGDSVEFCVPGFDRWHVYNGSCRLID